jgi:hypothetical protein
MAALIERVMIPVLFLAGVLAASLLGRDSGQSVVRGPEVAEARSVGVHLRLQEN